MVTTSLRESTRKVSGEPRRCGECGVSADERVLVGLKNDRRRNGLRYCIRCHPAFHGMGYGLVTRMA